MSLDDGEYGYFDYCGNDPLYMHAFTCARVATLPAMTVDHYDATGSRAVAEISVPATSEAVRFALDHSLNPKETQ